METIKISVEVSVNLSESTQQFIASLVGAALKPTCSCASLDDEAPVPAPAPAPEATSSLDIEDLRTKLKDKVNEHRETIKAKLTELGAPSVTKLDKSKYQEMYDFLISLP
jgi:hypothetical protein